MDSGHTWHSTKVVFGLGNPGKRYAKTRHNLGYQVVDRMAFLKNEEFINNGSRISLCRIDTAKGEYYLAKPLTYMNKSGLAVLELIDILAVSTQDILVVCDDCNLPPGKIRYRLSGSDGGHKGLRSIIEALGSGDFPRLRLGIGQSDNLKPLEDYVLEEFSENEMKTIEQMIDKSVQIIEQWLAGALRSVSATYNVMLT